MKKIVFLSAVLIMISAVSFGATRDIRVYGTNKSQKISGSTSLGYYSYRNFVVWAEALGQTAFCYSSLYNHSNGLVAYAESHGATPPGLGNRINYYGTGASWELYGVVGAGNPWDHAYAGITW